MGQENTNIDNKPQSGQQASPLGQQHDPNQYTDPDDARQNTGGDRQGGEQNVGFDDRNDRSRGYDPATQQADSPDAAWRPTDDENSQTSREVEEEARDQAIPGTTGF